jgi:phospholipase A1
VKNLWPVLLPLILFFLIGVLARATGATPPEQHQFSRVAATPGLTLHREMFVLPYTYSNDYAGSETEVIFQLSAKHRLLGTRFFFAFTQVSYWQAYNTDASSPFRDTNFNPEVLYRSATRRLGAGTLGFDAGFEHESNGQRVPLSRSWNLAYLAPYYHGDNWLAYIKLRARVPEEEKETPAAARGDDNPDLTDYLGYSDIHLYWRPAPRHQLHVALRGYLGTDKGNVSLYYSVRVIREEDVFLALRLFSGYGESLLDYNRSVNRIGVGVMFNR